VGNADRQLKSIGSEVKALQQALGDKATVSVPLGVDLDTHFPTGERVERLG